MKPVADFFIYQGMIAALPAVFLASWLVLIPLPYFSERYAPWQLPYAGLLAIAVAIEVLAFILPLWSFHQEMVNQKRTESDRLQRRLSEIQAQLAASRGTTGKQAALVVDVSARLSAIAELPQWPIDTKTKWLFGFITSALLLPAIAQYTGLIQGWSVNLNILFIG